MLVKRETAHEDDFFWEHDMAWVKPQSSRRQVNNAAAFLVGVSQKTTVGFIAYADIQASTKIFNNWRSSHSYPLNRLKLLLATRAKAEYPDAIIAHRLKRAHSILEKLQKEERMKLSQMQDIGGCRAIVGSIDQVYRIRDLFLKSRIRHELHNTKDYIDRPKESGYRGIHLIYEYRGYKKGEYDGLRIEVQLRTHLQHLWASSVEIIGAFRNQALKSSLGDESWLRLFALMGNVFAMKERRPLVPNMPSSRDAMKKELVELRHDLSLLSTVSQINLKHKWVEDRMPNSYYFLLRGDYQNQTVWVQGFPKENLLDAQKEYDKIEQEIMGQRGQLAVLVSVDSFKHLEEAYPSYSARAGNVAAHFLFEISQFIQ